MKYSGRIPVWLSSHGAISRDCLLVEVDVQLLTCFRRLLSCHDEIFGECLDLLAQFFVEMPDIRIEECVIAAIHYRQI